MRQREEVPIPSAGEDRVKVGAEGAGEILILGAGCAGLSLAWHLLDAGVKSPICLFDQRKGYTNDRTWSYWQVEPTPFDDLADAHWTAWTVVDHLGRSAQRGTVRYPYCHLRSDRFYRRVLTRLEGAPNVTLRLGQQIEWAGTTEEGVAVETGEGRWEGGRLFDSIGMTSSRGGAQDIPSRAQRPWLQHFLGLRIRTSRPVFSTETLTLMDHRVSQENGPHFVYLLPFSPTEALVENTYLFPAYISPTHHRRELTDYLASYWGLRPGEWVIEEEEGGAIPMGGFAESPEGPRRVHRIGLAGGAARPSTGYAFLRIQRQSRQLAWALANGKQPASARSVFGAGKYRLFDRILLHALGRSPQMAPAFFTTLFERGATERVVRFLTECSGWRDDLSVVRAVLQWPFVRMLGRSIGIIPHTTAGARQGTEITPAPAPAKPALQ
jgi:lycopene beta-cyclase